MTLTVRTTVALLFVCLLSSLETGKGAVPPSNDLVYRSVVSEVRLIFFATDEQKRPVEDLKSSDFAVVDNDVVVREFRSFTKTEAMRLNAVVLVDMSESMALEFRREIANAVSVATRTRWRQDDRLSIVTFGGTSTAVACDGTCDAWTSDQLSGLHPQGLTPLFDAIWFGARRLPKRHAPDELPVLVLFSDGEDTVSRNSFRDALEAAVERDAEVYSVHTARPSQRADGVRGLQILAAATGGEYFEANDGAGKIMSAILEDLHGAYVVTYPLPAREVGFHAVQILPTHNLNLNFRCRSGYYYRGEAR